MVLERLWGAGGSGAPSGLGGAWGLSGSAIIPSFMVIVSFTLKLFGICISLGCLYLSLNSWKRVQW